jgi:N-methylhydantoinase A/oxoprolinase/acetone carboxylase beta subunit
VRIGVDVGGTNTDAVLLDPSANGDPVRAVYKTATTADVTGGIVAAITAVLQQSGVSVSAVTGVMIGTTHFTNAVVERRRLLPVGVIRLGLPATQALPPMVDWPDDLRAVVEGYVALAHGGREFDGRPISPFDEGEIRRAAEEMRAREIGAVAVVSVFSPVDPSDEERAAEIVRAVLPDAFITRSFDIGRIGLLERESAAIINCCLHRLAADTIDGFRRALIALGLDAPVFLTQNDGTLMTAEFAQRYPILTFASGPTNSMRGAAFLSGLKDAIVVDIGGTTTDVGVLMNGFPREAAIAADIGGVRTNFRMPDVHSIGLGGGSLVNLPAVGPRSVGYELTTRALVFGGDTLTATDIAVASGGASVGDATRIAHLPRTTIDTALAAIGDRVDDAVDRVKLSAAPEPVIVVGGGRILVQRPIAGASELVIPPHHDVANAVGAAIAQASGEIERIFSLEGTSRAEVMAEAERLAGERAVAAGADPATIEIVDREDIPLAYLPGNATRVRVKAVGDLSTAV